MKTYAIEFNEKSENFGRITVHNSKKEANSLGNGLTTFTAPEELFEARGITSAQMVDVYNHHNPEAKIQKFSDRQAAANRIFALAQAKATDVSGNPIPPKAEKVKKEKTPKAEKGEGKVGRKGKFSGKTLYPADDLTENPRREGTQAYKSMSIIMAEPGVTFEDFIAKGGKTSNLLWDIEHKRVIVK